MRSAPSNPDAFLLGCLDDVLKALQALLDAAIQVLRRKRLGSRWKHGNLLCTSRHRVLKALHLAAVLIVFGLFGRALPRGSGGTNFTGRSTFTLMSIVNRMAAYSQVGLAQSVSSGGRAPSDWGSGRGSEPQVSELFVPSLWLRLPVAAPTWG